MRVKSKSGDARADGVASMTGFATAEAGAWTWEARSVNARGLDLRLRLAEGRERLEPELRRRVAACITRGAVSVQLRRHDLRSAAATPRLDAEAFAAAVEALSAARAAMERAGLPAAPSTPAGLLSLRGVFEPAREAEEEDSAEDAALLDAFDTLLDRLVEARGAEGAALHGAVEAALAVIVAQTEAAEAAHAAQLAERPARLHEKVAALLGARAEVEPQRLAQELALIAMKEDVREELDRLRAHLDAARALLAGGGPVGRRLDFLTQEFNREANTLCSKSASPALTAAGLEMKVAIDRLREQAANLE